MTSENPFPPMVPSTLTRQDYERVYRAMDVSPLPDDCGNLCGRSCCQEYQPGVGMYLLPGEEQLFTGSEPWLRWTFQRAEEHDFPPEWKGHVAFVLCNSSCPREKRPVQCRTFPLMPYIDCRGSLTVRLDVLNGPFLCPLVRNPRRYPLRRAFVEAVLEGWKILVRDPLIRRDVEYQSRKLDEELRSPWVKLLRPLTGGSRRRGREASHGFGETTSPVEDEKP